MLAKDFITKEFPVLKIDDTVEYALGLMDDFKVRHLPLIGTDELFNALICEKDLLNLPYPASSVAEAARDSHSILPDADWQEALAIMAQHHLSILPVVNEERDYQGIISADTIIELTARLTNADASGAVIVLEIFPQDYSATDIARIIESNNAHILSLLTEIERTSGKWIVSIKVDVEDASAILRSFERFNYHVRYAFLKNSVIDDILAQRINELNRFMNI